jgi:hypothetical protein
MAYSVDWPSKTVTIPKTDLSLVSASPEIYELDVTVFWAAIHDIQDGDGITYDTIMASNAPQSISGITLVRTVEIINDYQIEFEDGQYQVNLIGANNNILSARVQNQVSLNPSNSAGAIVVSGGVGSFTVDDRTKLGRIDATTQVINANNP